MTRSLNVTLPHVAQKIVPRYIIASISTRFLHLAKTVPKSITYSPIKSSNKKSLTNVFAPLQQQNILLSEHQLATE